MTRIRITESGRTALAPLTRLRSFVETRSGIFTPLELLRLQHPQAVVYYDHPDPVFADAFLRRNPFCKKYNNEPVDLEVRENDYQPWDMVNRIAERISDEYALLHQDGGYDLSGLQIVGDTGKMSVHSSAVIYPGVVFDTTEGPVVIGENVTITPFSFVKGPVVVGAGSSLDNCKIAGSVVGSTCRLGGEIESSIIGDFTNKHHEGFLGHSVVGRWVNMGALSTTSDLKNNYGEIRIKIADQTINTRQIKLGSVIGDYVKIAIGVMLNTGTVVDAGSNVFEGRAGGYFPPFSWGDGKYEYGRFIGDAEKIMARRKQILSDADRELLGKIQ